MSTENLNNTSVETQEVETSTPEVKTYTEEELQSYGDRRVTEALKKQQKKYEKQLQDQVSLAKLDGDARTIADLENKLKTALEENAAFKIEKNRSELKSVLSARDLPAELADIIIIDDDIEASQARIDTLDKLWKAGIRKGVESRLAANGGAPRGNGSIPAEGMTKEAFMKLGLREQQTWMKANPEAYNKLYN